MARSHLRKGGTHPTRASTRKGIRSVAQSFSTGTRFAGSRHHPAPATRRDRSLAPRRASVNPAQCGGHNGSLSRLAAVEDVFDGLDDLRCRTQLMSRCENESQPRGSARYVRRVRRRRKHRRVDHHRPRWLPSATSEILLVLVRAHAVASSSHQAPLLSAGTNPAHEEACCSDPSACSGPIFSRYPSPWERRHIVRSSAVERPPGSRIRAQPRIGILHRAVRLGGSLRAGREGVRFHPLNRAVCESGRHAGGPSDRESSF